MSENVTSTTSFALFFAAGFATCLAVTASTGIIRFERWLRRRESPEAVARATRALIGSENVKMVLVVNNDLKMGKGKIGAQCGHAALSAYLRAEEMNNPFLPIWVEEGEAKVVLRGTEDELNSAFKKAGQMHITAVRIRDAGRTQIAAGSMTVVAIGPANESTLDKITGHLKLL